MLFELKYATITSCIYSARNIYFRCFSPLQNTRMIISIKNSICLLAMATISNALLNADRHIYGTLDASEYDRPSSEIDPSVMRMVQKMTLPEKIGQMTQLDQELVMHKNGTLNRAAVRYYAENYFVGSYLNQLAK